MNKLWVDRLQGSWYRTPAELESGKVIRKLPQNSSLPRKCGFVHNRCRCCRYDSDLTDRVLAAELDEGRFKLEMIAPTTLTTFSL